MTVLTPAKARRRKVAPRCTCPACLKDFYQSPDGVFYCIVDREWAAYASGQYIAASANQIAITEALAIFRIDQTAAQAIEAAAAERDLECDVAQAAGDPDVVAALVDDHTCRMAQCRTCFASMICTYHGCTSSTCRTCDRNKQTDADTHALNQSMLDMPPFVRYYPALGGFSWGDHPNAYGSYSEAVTERSKWLANR